MNTNPLLQEIYAAREELLNKFHGDVHMYVEDARARTIASGRVAASTSESQESVEKAAPRKNMTWEQLRSITREI